MLISAPRKWACCVSTELLSEAKLSFAATPPQKPTGKGHTSIHKEKNQQQFPSLFFFLPFSSGLWTCLKVQVMRPIWMVLVLQSKFKDTESQSLGLTGKCCFILSRQKKFKVWSLHRNSKVRTEREVKDCPMTLEGMTFFFPAGKSNSQSCAFGTIRHT